MYLRAKYNDDPTFRSSKIVYALQPERFDGTLDARFVEKLGMNEFTADDLAAIAGGPVDYVALNKLAIDYSDAIMQITEDVDPEILDYAVKSGKPFLPFTPQEARKESHINFYRSLIETDEEDD